MAFFGYELWPFENVDRRKNATKTEHSRFANGYVKKEEEEEEKKEL